MDEAQVSTLETPKRPQLAPVVRSLLARLRVRIRRYVWLEGLLATVAMAVAAAWLAFGIDWWFEPPSLVRRALLASAVTAAALVFYYFVLRRAFVRLSDRSLAVVLERIFARFDEALLTAVELTGRREPLEPYTREMLVQVCAAAAARSADVDLRRVFDTTPLWRKGSVAVLLSASMLIYAIGAPDMLRLAARRLAGLTDEPWPRRTLLVIDGFKRGEAVVARGADLEIVVKADLAKEVPRGVQVRWTDDAGRGRVEMVREGNAVRGRDEHQRFRHTFAAVLSPIRFEVRGGDARIRNLSIRVVDSPAIEMTAHIEYPEYMRRAPTEQQVLGPVAVPQGARITVRAKANKPLARVTVDRAGADAAAHVTTLDFAEQGEHKREFALELGAVERDDTVLFTLLDADGIESRQPERLSISAIADEPPQVAVRLAGIGSAVTPQVRLPLVGYVEDDYGVANLALECQLGEAAPRPLPFAVDAARKTRVEINEAFELAQLSLAPEQRLLVAVAAVDNRRLNEGQPPNTGRGERFALDVVTPDELRAILESRELNLRQRFETIIQEVTDTRDSLAQLDVLENEATAEEGIGDREQGTREEATVAQAARSDDPNEEIQNPKSKVQSGTGDTFERRLGRSQVRVERALQNSRKNAEELLGVAISFDDICAEMINNRIDTEELRSRLADQIAAPLRRLAEKAFPELEKLLATLRGQLLDARVDEAIAREAVAQTDLLLVEMQHIRDRMLELETFNEAVDQLRSILAAQQDLNQRTKNERTSAVRSLLE